MIPEGPPEVSAEVPPDQAWRDLRHAVVVVLQREGRIFTQGELWVLGQFMALPSPAGSLFARLQLRRPVAFALDALAYAEVPDVPAATATLVSHGLADRLMAVATPAVLVGLSTVPELKVAAAGLGLKRSGRRAELVERLLGEDAATVSAALARRGIVLRHRGLFRRVTRLFLGDHRGDLSRVVVARMGVVRYPDYVPTGGLGMFPTRRALRDYETLRRFRYAELEDADATARVALAAATRLPRPAPHRWRFSGRRYAEEAALAALRQVERGGEHAHAHQGYQSLLTLTPSPQVRAEAVVRCALCLEQLGRPAEAADLCDDERDRVGPVAARRLERSGRRLARKAGKAWRPLPPLTKARTRTVHLQSAPSAARARPLWRVAGQDTTIERAVARTLSDLGRHAVHTESGIWTTMFGLLYFEVLFAPVPEMLPTPMLTGPLDLHDPGFLARRQPRADAVRDAIVAGRAPDLLAQAAQAHDRAAITGVDWMLVDEVSLPELADDLGPAALAAIMGVIAQAPLSARRGLPDLCVLPGPRVKLPAALPATVKAEACFVEIKGPTDSLREAQRVWHARLLDAGVPVEIWAIKPRP